MARAMCCAALGLHLAGAALQTATRGQGCSRRDRTILDNRPRKHSTAFVDVLPIMVDLVNTSDHQRATKKIAAMLGDVMGCNDNLMKMISPAGVRWGSIGNCIRKDQGISHECAQCMPSFLQGVLGTQLSEFTSSCMAMCASVAPFAVRCFKKIGDMPRFLNCINPAIQHRSLPCMKCMHPHLLQYNRCADPERHEAYKSGIDKFIADIASGRLGIQALAPDFEDQIGAPQQFFTKHQHEIAELSTKILGGYYQGIENFNQKFPRHRNENGEEIIQFKQDRAPHHPKNEDLSTDGPVKEINFKQQHRNPIHKRQADDGGEVINFRQFRKRLRTKTQLA